jgi:ATP synthase subunit 6
MQKLPKNINFTKMMLAPLEQFKLIAILPLSFLNIDFSLTNALIISSAILISFLLLSFFLKKYQIKSDFFYLYHIPTISQSFIELLNKISIQLVYSNLNKSGEKYYPYVCTLFFFILVCNLIGLVPYSFTLTSHIIITFFLSFSVFIGVNLIGFEKHTFVLFSLIIPANSSLILALVLVPIEFVSYLAKPISLGVRLFINLMAGHTLLKVILGFSWSLILVDSFFYFFLHLIPLCLLIVLMGLELGVALIQAYVFTILTCIYLNDSINLH